MSGVLRDILIRERAAIMNMVLSCTEKQYERLVEKELEQQDKTIKEQEKKYELLERIQDDPELQKELIEQYGI